MSQDDFPQRFERAYVALVNERAMLRGYKKGDILEMMEFKDGKNTGRTVRVLVTYILEEFAGLEDGYCIMATSLMKEDAE